MGLWERWSQDNEAPGLNPHWFAAGCRLLARGETTKAQLVSAFNLDAEAEAELDAIITHYGTLINTEQVEYIAKLQDVMLLSEARMLTKAQAKILLGF